MKDKLIIYEGAMCCSTGVCGPEPDKTLIEFGDAIKKIQKQNPELEVIRASITFNLNMFLDNKDIFELVREKGQSILPITTYNSKIVAKQKYLSTDEMEKIVKGKQI